MISISGDWYVFATFNVNTSVHLFIRRNTYSKEIGAHHFRSLKQYWNSCGKLHYWCNSKYICALIDKSCLKFRYMINEPAKKGQMPGNVVNIVWKFDLWGVQWRQISNRVELLSNGLVLNVVVYCH